MSDLTYCEKTGKAKHATAADARKALKRLLKPGSAYKCMFCGSWHHTKWVDRVSREFGTANKRKNK